MSFRQGFPLKEGLLPRPHLEERLMDGLRYPLVTVVAGPGYAKTQSLAAFAKKLPQRVAWQHISRFDNIPSRFWLGLVRSFQDEFPELAEQFAELGFRETESRFEQFARLLAKESYGKDQIVYVVDDVHFITNQQVRGFYTDLIRLQLENFCLILISGAWLEFDPEVISPQAVYHLGADDLKFTPQETRELFRQQGVLLEEAQLAAIDQHLSGWPLPTFLLAKRQWQDRAMDANLSDLGNVLSHQIFEEEFFSRYSPIVRQVLLKLSLFPSFPAQIAARICGPEHDAECKKAVDENLFISYDHVLDQYVFLAAYRQFLSQKAFVLDTAETERIYTLTGDWYAENDKPLEAIEAYGKSRQYDKLLQAILNHSNSYMSLELARFLQVHLELFPPEYVETHPIIEYLLATIYLNNLEMEEAQARLMRLEERMLHHPDVEMRRWILGEIEVTKAGISLLQNSDAFVEQYRRAADYLPQGSRIQKKGQLLVGNSCVLFMENHEAGALQHMEECFFQAAPYLVQVMHGSGRGMDWLFAAESAYVRYDFRRSAECARRAIQEAAQTGQHDIVCNAHYVLAVTAMMQGRYTSFRKETEFIGAYIETHGLQQLSVIRDYAQGFFEAKIGSLENLAGWIIVDDLKFYTAPMSMGRESILKVAYMMEKERYYELIAFLERAEELCRKRGYWLDTLQSHILRAICFQKTGNEEKAISALAQAYLMAHQNGIVTPFTEKGSYMRSLISLARKSSFPFDGAWLDDIQAKATTHAKRLQSMTKEHQQHLKPSPSQPAANQQLTRRELGVLQGLAQGLTREEIAALQGISINTVKSSIRSIYDKLNAINRADAIRIATAQGLFD